PPARASASATPSAPSPPRSAQRRTPGYARSESAPASPAAALSSSPPLTAASNPHTIPPQPVDRSPGRYTPSRRCEFSPALLPSQFSAPRCPAPSCWDSSPCKPAQSNSAAPAPTPATPSASPPIHGYAPPSSTSPAQIHS